MLKINTFAKINLTLDVLGKRSDGYHELRSIMQSIDLHDTLDLQRSDVLRIIPAANYPGLPTDESNIMAKVWRILKHTYSLPGELALGITKRIPIAAGLAGGSSNAAGIIEAVNEIFDLKLSLEDKKQVANQVGSDVAFCLVGGTILCEGRGERLTKIEPGFLSRVTLAKPELSVSTAEIYRNFSSAQVSLRGTDQWLAENSQLKIFGNDLQPVAFRLYPELDSLHRQLETNTGLCWQMSGSGPTLFTLDAKPHFEINQNAYCSRFNISNAHTNDCGVKIERR